MELPKRKCFCYDAILALAVSDVGQSTQKFPFSDEGSVRSSARRRDWIQLQLKEAHMKKRLAVAFTTLTVLGALAPAIAAAAPQPPTQGGLGAGQSGQCTGNPADRPASCGP
jgi:hypothetical protein